MAMPRPTGARAAGPPEAVLDHLDDDADVIVPLANGEPVSVLDAMEAGAERFRGVRVHQMHALHDGPTSTARCASTCSTCRTSCRR
jgi:hypothetical protein